MRRPSENFRRPFCLMYSNDWFVIGWLDAQAVWVLMAVM
ncbi:hypothetical protein l11_09210 [Neisseria weaveri LMG 5135]|nr:hypothetical protein l11_09210 [Neisseria weaveri LMG 5135]